MSQRRKRWERRKWATPCWRPFEINASIGKLLVKEMQ
jgi:hypothetical protein